MKWLEKDPLDSLRQFLPLKISMKKSFLGIDIGTSSIKALLLFEDGKIIKNRISYSENSLLGIKNAVKKALKKFKKYHITAISFSSQVGTYVLDDKDIIWWNSSSGKEQLDFIKSKCSKEEFIDERKRKKKARCDRGRKQCESAS